MDEGSGCVGVDIEVLRRTDSDSVGNRSTIVFGLTLRLEVLRDV